MADPIDHFPAILGLIGTLSGTAIGFAGGFVGQWLLEGKKQKAEKKKKKAEKLEELVTAIYEHSHSLRDVYERIVVKNTHSEIVTPFSKIEAIKQVYFPELEEPIHNLRAAWVGYENFLHDHAPVLRQLDLSKTDHVTVKNERYEARDEYFNCFNAALNEIRDYAKREFQ
jgi:hypothetical protein